MLQTFSTLLLRMSLLHMGLILLTVQALPHSRAQGNRDRVNLEARFDERAFTDNIRDFRDPPLIDYCTREGCGGLDYKQIAHQYGALFYTEEQAKVAQEKWIKTHDRFRPSGARPEHHDYDVCCPTQRTYQKNTTMVNVDGQTRHLVHLAYFSPPKYQWVLHATCVGHQGTCGNKCHAEETIMHLLVVDSTSTNGIRLTFEPFKVPTYCSCKNYV